MFSYHHYHPSPEFIIPRSPLSKPLITSTLFPVFCLRQYLLWSRVRSHALSLLLCPIGHLFSGQKGPCKGVTQEARLTGPFRRLVTTILTFLPPQPLESFSCLLFSLPRPQILARPYASTCFPHPPLCEEGDIFSLLKMLFSGYRSNTCSWQNIWETQNSIPKARIIPLRVNTTVHYAHAHIPPF